MAEPDGEWLFVNDWIALKDWSDLNRHELEHRYSRVSLSFANGPPRGSANPLNSRSIGTT
jgi:hypothetical protein